jgi:hypothetical protein
MTAAALLSRLDKVRQTGPDRWIASCPTRHDKHPSMTIRELPDGRVLVHDFGGDSVAEILDAIGLQMSDLFPPKPQAPGAGQAHRERSPFSAIDALRCLAFEARLVHLALSDYLNNKPISQADVDRLAIARDRIEEALNVTAH